MKAKFNDIMIRLSLMALCASLLWVAVVDWQWYNICAIWLCSAAVGYFTVREIGATMKTIRKEKRHAK